MNEIVSILIFSHPSLGYDKKQISYPIDLSARYPMNGSGLCNQMMRVVNTFHYCEPVKNRIYFDLFSNDIFSGTMRPLSSIIDLERMRENGHNVFDITEMVPFDVSGGQKIPKKYYIYDDSYVFRLYHENSYKFGEICRSLVFSDKFESVAKAVIEKSGLSGKKVNLAHLRIDKDYEIHVTGSANEKFDIKDAHFANRVNAYGGIVESYRKAIRENCDREKPLVLLLEDIHHPLVKDLAEEYEIFAFGKEMVSELYNEKFGQHIEGREYFALVDLLIGKNLDTETFIGLEQSNPGPDGQKHSSSFSIFLKYITNCKKTIMV